jgi:hypothetical protein
MHENNWLFVPDPSCLVYSIIYVATALASQFLIWMPWKMPKQHISKKKSDKQFRLDISLALVMGVFAIWFVLFPPTTKLTGVFWILVLTGGSIYPVLHFWQWRLKTSLWRYVLTAISILVVGASVTARIWPIFYPSISVTAYLSPSYKEGEKVAGITWKKEFQDIRVVLHNVTEYPLHNLNLTVQSVEKSEDLFWGMGQLSDIDGVTFHPPRWPDMSITLRGQDGQKYKINPRDDAGPLSFGDRWGVSCPVLPLETDLLLMLAAESPTTNSPKKLRITGTLEGVSYGGYQIKKFDQVVDVTR